MSKRLRLYGLGPVPTALGEAVSDFGRALFKNAASASIITLWVNNPSFRKVYVAHAMEYLIFTKNAAAAKNRPTDDELRAMYERQLGELFRNTIRSGQGTLDSGTTWRSRWELWHTTYSLLLRDNDTFKFEIGGESFKNTRLPVFDSYFVRALLDFMYKRPTQFHALLHRSYSNTTRNSEQQLTAKRLIAEYAKIHTDLVAEPEKEINLSEPPWETNMPTKKPLGPRAETTHDIKPWAGSFVHKSDRDSTGPENSTSKDNTMFKNEAVKDLFALTKGRVLLAILASFTLKFLPIKWPLWARITGTHEKVANHALTKVGVACTLHALAEHFDAPEKVKQQTRDLQKAAITIASMELPIEDFFNEAAEKLASGHGVDELKKAAKSLKS